MNTVVGQPVSLVELFPPASPVLRHGRHTLKTGCPAELTSRAPVRAARTRLRSRHA